MSSDLDAVHAIARQYMDALYEGDVEKLAAIFHPASHLYSVDADGRLVDWPRDRWFEVVRGRASGKSRGLVRDDRIVSIDLAGPELAHVKLETSLAPRYYTDYLTVMKLREGWIIMSKSFRYTDRA